MENGADWEFKKTHQGKAKYCLAVSIGVVMSLSSTMFAAPATKTVDAAPLKELLARQKNVRSFTANFTQTKALSTLRSPLSSEGKIWFMAPNWFRWELGDPPKTIIIGTPTELTIIQPTKKRAQRKSLASVDTMRDTGFLGMMKFPGGVSLEEFNKLVQVLALEESGSRCHLEILPRDAAAVRALSAIKLDFDRTTGHWLSFEMVTREGSSIRNEFFHVQLNPKLDKSLFHYDLTGFQVTDEKN